MQRQFTYLAINYLQPGQYQPRQTFNEEGIKELAESIKTHGLIEPLIVRKVSDKQYEIIAGERRWRAAKLVGLQELPCLIGDYQDKHAAAITLIENIQREDLNLLEEANGYQRLISEFHFSQEDIAKLLGKSRSHIANILRLLTLCKPVQTHIKQNLLSLGHARMLVGLSEKQQIELANFVIENGCSVRELEKKVRTIKSAIESKDTSHKDGQPDIERLQILLSEQMGAPVQIITDLNQGGWLNIKYFNNDTLSGLLERLGLRYD